MGVFVIAAIDDVKERALDFLGDRAAAAGTELNAVQLADRGHLSGRAGKEGFIADVHLVAGDALLHHRSGV